MKKIFAVLLVMLLGTANVSFAASTQVDALIEKLTDKGILTKKEAREMKMEIAEDAKALQEDGLKSQLPTWVQNTKLKGDVRVRYQYERRVNDTESRTRGRVRFRLGLENKINDQWNIGAGLASSESGSSGTDDARSTNMTFNDSFRRGDIRLDYAYAEYQPAPWAKIIGGKFVKTNYLWAPTDMLWDTDINPAGGSIHLEHKLTDSLEAYVNNGLWVIDENNKSDRTDPYMIYGQAGLKVTQGILGLNVAGNYYGFNGVKGITLDGTSATNTLDGGVLKYDYDAMGASAEFSIKDPTIGLLPVEKLAFFGDYIQNVDSSVDDKSGWAAGVKIGDEKVAGPKQWQLKYQYTNLRKDAWLDAFPDSDRLGGATDVKGQELELALGIAKNVTLGFDYYKDMRIKAAKNPQHIFQADLNIKF